VNPSVLHRCRVVPILAAVVLLAAGCRTSRPASASFASVEISGKSKEEILTATVAVFTADGYHAMYNVRDELLFEKEGTRGDEIAHGGWIADTGVRKRVRAEVVSPAPNEYRLQCHAYIVRHPGDSVFEDEVRLKNVRARPYQKLLDEVAARLKKE